MVWVRVNVWGECEMDFYQLFLKILKAKDFGAVSVQIIVLFCCLIMCND